MVFNYCQAKTGLTSLQDIMLHDILSHNIMSHNILSCDNTQHDIISSGV